MPLIQRRVQDFFAKPPALKVNPDEVVALGAAIQAHVLDRGRKPQGAPKAPPVTIAVESRYGGSPFRGSCAQGGSAGCGPRRAASYPASAAAPTAGATQAPACRSRRARRRRR